MGLGHFGGGVAAARWLAWQGARPSPIRQPSRAARHDDRLFGSSPLPIARSSSTVRNGIDVNVCGRGTVHNQIRKAAKHVASRSVKIGRIELGGRANALNSDIKFCKKSLGRISAPRLIPLQRCADLSKRLRVNIEREATHQVLPTIM
jgi:hypothetical protein